ncbi:MAG: AAA family ATPase [Bacteroidales bacterium]|nr:AAA family ATPase [Bacteroidales bacterium]
MDTLLFRYHNLLKETDTGFLRYLHGIIPWNDRMIAIVGSRGVGKTTLLLQHIKLHLPVEKTLYVSADDLYFSDHSLFDLARQFHQLGGEHLFIDEIHKYANWSQELKNIYDAIPRLQVVFTGSSILDIYHGTSDLSRRVLTFTMHGMSFREYLAMKKGIQIPVHSLDDIMQHKVNAEGLDYPLVAFRDYLRRGYYPFSDGEGYELRLINVVNRVIETDIPLYARLNISSIVKMKRLLNVIAASVPFKPNVSKLANILEISRETVADYLEYMTRAKLLNTLRESTQGIRGLGKVDKIYLENTNLAYALTPNPEIGNIRETFFLNQLQVNHGVLSSTISDFFVDDTYTFELGGKNKRQKQIEHADNAFVVKDDVERGVFNILPLWHFGLMY